MESPREEMLLSRLFSRTLVLQNQAVETVAVYGAVARSECPIRVERIASVMCFVHDKLLPNLTFRR